MKDAEHTEDRAEKNAGDVLIDDFRVCDEPFHRVRRERRVMLSVTTPPPKPEPVRRPAKVARMLALAHHLQNAIDRGLVADRAAVARKLGLTRARVTQLLDLTLLAPDLQARVLGLEAVDGVEPLAERAFRAVAHAGSWEEQRMAWRLRGVSDIVGASSASSATLPTCSDTIDAPRAL